MSSNIRVNRICQYCRKEFEARTTVTKYCSKTCSQKGYKQRKRQEKIRRSNHETHQAQTQPIEIIKAKEYLSIAETCQLLGISRRTVYRMFEQGAVRKFKIGRRTILSRQELDDFLKCNIEKVQESEKTDWGNPESYQRESTYNYNEIKEKYKISDKAIYDLIKRHDIPRMRKGWYTYVPKQIIDELLT
jgi:excisionase family DNA binding protein